MESGARVFILRGQMPFAELAEQFVGVVARVERFATRHRGPFIAAIRRQTFPGGGGKFKIEVAMRLDFETWHSRTGSA